VEIFLTMSLNLTMRAAPIPSPKLPLPLLPPALSAEERDELLQELFLWSRANSLLFLQTRYRDQPEKLGEFLSGEGMEGKEWGIGGIEFGGISGNMRGSVGGAIYVPLQELRKWLVAKGGTIARVYVDAN
jgi:hypothetical protein